MKLVRMFNRPMPMWFGVLLLVLALSGPVIAAAVYPFFATGSAAFGPGGVIDLGNVNASNNAVNGNADPQIAAGSGGINLASQVPTGGLFSYNVCLNLTCSGAGNVTVAEQINATAITGNVPMLSSPLTATAPGVDPPCYQYGGAQCNANIHVTTFVPGTPQNVIISGTCTTNTLCSFSSASNHIPLTGNAQFTNAPTCFATAYTVPGLLVFADSTTTPTNIALAVYNTSGASVTGSIAVTWFCYGV